MPAGPFPASLPRQAWDIIFPLPQLHLSATAALSGHLAQVIGRFSSRGGRACGGILLGPAGIEVAYERLGDPSAPPALLMMGAGAQMLSWPEGFCAELAGRGVQVIRFDNRDAGRSSHWADAPAPDLPR